MNEFQSQLSESSEIPMQIQNTLLKALKSAQPYLQQQLISNIRKRINDMDKTIERIIDPIQFLIFTLINRISQIKQITNLNIDKEDYENLQVAVQKSQAQIRKHIRLEQQLKIYMDDLEQKVEDQQKQLKIQENKYLQLYQSTRSVIDEKRLMEKQIKSLQSKLKNSEKNILSHKSSKVMSDVSVYESQTNAYKLYDKNRISKNTFLYGKKIKKSTEERQSKSKLINGHINVSLGESPSKKRMNTQNTQLRQLTRTIQLKQGYRKQSRKLVIKNESKKKDARCNSVCH